MTEAELANVLRTNVRALMSGQTGIGLRLPNEKFNDNGQKHVRHSYQVGDARLIGVGTTTKFSEKVGRVYNEIFWPKNLGEGDARELSTVLENGWRRASLHSDLTLGEPHTSTRPDSDWFVLVVSVPLQARIIT